MPMVWLQQRSLASLVLGSSLFACALAGTSACQGKVEKQDRAQSDGGDASEPVRRDGGTAGGGASGGDAGPADPGPPRGDDAGSPARSIWQPRPGTSWQWQLSGKLDTSVDVEVFDVDLFETSAAEIASLHAAGRKVVCYFDTAYEPYRPDEASLRPYRGKTIEGWADQRWLDVRQPGVLAVMLARLDLAAEKQCDGVEADDVDVVYNDTGFDFSRDDQRTFIRTLAREARARGMAFGLKNALEDVQELLDDVDFALNEECFAFDECELLTPLVRAGKAVFHVEYPQGGETLEQRGRAFCARANALGLDSLVKNLELDAPRYACR